jgi:hypothetical protein
VPQVAVPGLLPSQNGLHFSNYYPHEPAISVPLPMGRSLNIGDAANGLCGGMAYVVRDFFEAGQATPSDTQPPAAGTPLYKFIVQRLLDSFDLPFGINRYLELMTPLFPDVGLIGLPGRASVMVSTEWPAIKSDLDAGHPVPLGLIKVKSARPRDLGQNHQVLAYAYDLEGTTLSISVYDPNYPNNDDVRMSLNIADPHQPVPVTYTPQESVFCFFRTNYSPRQPPAL